MLPRGESQIIFFVSHKERHVWAGGSAPDLPFPWGSGTPSKNASVDPTGVAAKWHLNPLNGLSRVHECDRRQTERQTDHTTEKYVQSLALHDVVRPNNINNRQTSFCFADASTKTAFHCSASLRPASVVIILYNQCNTTHSLISEAPCISIPD